MKLARQRPAETGGVAGAVALLVAHLAGVTQPDLILSLAVVIGFLPAAITWAVTLFRGQAGNDGTP